MGLHMPSRTRQRLGFSRDNVLVTHQTVVYRQGGRIEHPIQDKQLAHHDREHGPMQGKERIRLILGGKQRTSGIGQGHPMARFVFSRSICWHGSIVNLFRQRISGLVVVDTDSVWL